MSVSLGPSCILEGQWSGSEQKTGDDAGFRMSAIPAGPS
jgi:hypothetical protein